MKKRLIIFSTKWRFQRSLNLLENWEVFLNPTEKNKWSTDSSKRFGPEYAAAVGRLRPDFVIGVCNACSEAAWDSMSKPALYGTKYISWSTDSYRHTKRCTTSDLHLTSIPDGSMKDSDVFVPLFHEWWEPPTLMAKRAHKIGIHCRNYGVADGWREKTLDNIRTEFGTALLVNKQNVSPQKYMDEIRQFKYGLNLAVYPDGLPNFRNFELGAAGVMPVCYAPNPKVTNMLRGLFGDNVRLFKKSGDILSAIREPYDPQKLQDYYNEQHSLRARLRTIFSRFFGLAFK